MGSIAEDNFTSSSEGSAFRGSIRYPLLPLELQGLPSLMASSAAAGIFTRSILHPLDTAKAIIQVQTHREQWEGSEARWRFRTLETIKTVWRNEGLRGLYRGFA